MENSIARVDTGTSAIGSARIQVLNLGNYSPSRSASCARPRMLFSLYIQIEQIKPQTPSLYHARITHDKTTKLQICTSFDYFKERPQEFRRQATSIVGFDIVRINNLSKINHWQSFRLFNYFGIWSTSAEFCCTILDETYKTPKPCHTFYAASRQSQHPDPFHSHYPLPSED
jgi:hypothetical protein